MKIIGRNNREIRTLDEYKEYAPPERDYQWAPEHSAMEFAKKVLANKLLEELSLSYPDIILESAYPEQLTYFDSYGGPRHHHLACVGYIDGEKTAVCFEAKATETFGSTTVQQELARAEAKLRNNENTHIPERISGLCKLLWKSEITSDIKKIQYQLLHAAAGSISFAKEIKANKCVFVVYQLETDKTTNSICQEHFESLSKFVSLFGKQLVPQIPCFIGNIENIDFTILYLQTRKI